MITKAELEKMVSERINSLVPSQQSVFRAGTSFVTGILMPEIERVENNCDTLENKAIFWMETNDRAIEHTESLQLTITTLKTEIQSMKDENGRIDQQRELLEKALVRVLSQPFKGDWDVQAVYIQHMLHEARNWKALTQKAEE